MKFLADPPPDYAFELSSRGIAYARQGKGAPQIGFQSLPPELLHITPLRDNLPLPQQFTEQLAALLPSRETRRRKAVLILPDYCARIAVLDFETFPAKPEEQSALVRFRLRKTVPFDIEHAAVSYFAQGSKGAQHVVVAAVAREVLDQYESVFRAAGYHPGLVTVSALASLDLVKQPETVVIAKLTGPFLTAMVAQGGALRLVRSVELHEASPDEISSVLYPTLAFVEDELGGQPARLLWSGLDDLMRDHGAQWEQEAGLPFEPLRGRFGVPGETNTGLLGFLEGAVQ